MRFAGAVTTITALNAIGALLSAAGIAIIAWLYGVSRPIEVYFCATQIFTLIIALSQAGKIGEFFLPAYHALKHARGEQAAFAGFSVMLNWLAMVTLALSAASVILAYPIMALAAPGFSASEQALGAQMLQAIAPLIVAQILMSTGQTLLYAESRFGSPETLSVAARLITPVAVITTFGIAGIWAAVIGLWAGTMVQVLGTVLMLGRLGYRHRWILRSPGLDHRRLLGQTLQTIWYVGATQIYILALNAALSLLPAGLYAVFRYAEQFHSKTYTILMRPISLVFFTAFSSASAAGSADARPMIRGALDQGLALITLAVAAFAAAGAPLLAALLGPKELGAANVVAITQLVLFLYMLQYLMLLEQISRKVAITLGRANPLFWSYAGCQLFSALAAWTIVPWLGLAGAAIVMAINVMLMTGAAYGVAALCDRSLVMIYSARALAQWLIAGTAGVLCGFALIRLAGIGAVATYDRLENGLAGFSIAATAMAGTFAAALLLRNADAIAYRAAMARLLGFAR